LPGTDSFSLVADLFDIVLGSQELFSLEDFEKNKSCSWTLTICPAGIKIKLVYNLLLPALKGLAESARKCCVCCHCHCGFFIQQFHL